MSSLFANLTFNFTGMFYWLLTSQWPLMHIPRLWVTIKKQTNEQTNKNIHFVALFTQCVGHRPHAAFMVMKLFSATWGLFCSFSLHILTKDLFFVFLIKRVYLCINTIGKNSLSVVLFFKKYCIKTYKN